MWICLLKSKILPMLKGSSRLWKISKAKPESTSHLNVVSKRWKDVSLESDVTGTYGGCMEDVSWPPIRMNKKVWDRDLYIPVIWTPLPWESKHSDSWSGYWPAQPRAHMIPHANGRLVGKPSPVSKLSLFGMSMSICGKVSSLDCELLREVSLASVRHLDTTMYERFGQSECIRIISETSTSRIVARHVNRCQWIQLRTHRDGSHKFLPTKVLWEKVLLQITAAPKWFYEAHYLQLRICAIGFKHPRSWSLISFDVSLGLVKGIKYACTFYLAFLCNVHTVSFTTAFAGFAQREEVAAAVDMLQQSWGYAPEVLKEGGPWSQVNGWLLLVSECVHLNNDGCECAAMAAMSLWYLNTIQYYKIC